MHTYAYSCVGVCMCHLGMPLAEDKVNDLFNLFFINIHLLMMDLRSSVFTPEASSGVVADSNRLNSLPSNDYVGLYCDAIALPR